MRADRALLALLAALGLGGRVVAAQSGTDGPRLAARAVRGPVDIKAWNPAGSIRFVGWDRDSVIVRGTVGRGEHLVLEGEGAAFKLVVEGRDSDPDAPPSHLVAWVPRGSTVSVKTVSADIVAADVSGWFFTVSGSMRLRGRATSIEAESMTGNLDLDLSTTWVKARTGDGRLRLGGAIQSADASTISGPLFVAAPSLVRGEFSSVTGDVHYAAAPLPNAIVELSNHSGAVELLLPATASATLTLSSISGSIANGFPAIRSTAWTPRSLRLSLGAGEAQLVVRTFKGPIRLGPPGG